MGRKTLAAIVSAVLVGMSGPAFADDELTYSGSSTIGMSILDAGALKAFEQKTGLRFKSVEQPGSGKGIDALVAGKVSIAGVSRTLKPEEKARKVLGTVIAYDAIALFVHRNNPVKNLSKEQIKGIFTGRIRNWNEVGGRNAPIHPLNEIQGQKRATSLAFQEMAMDHAPYGSGFKEIDLPRDEIVEVAKDENAVCAVSYGLLAAVDKNLRDNVKAITVNNIAPTDANIQSGAYLISRPLNLATKGLPKGNVKKFTDFMLSSEGQKIVAINFVPVKK